MTLRIKSSVGGFGRGFTLIEVLVATAIMALVLSAMNSVLFGALNLRFRAATAV